MSNESYHEPSEQTIKAIDHCRQDFANVRGVTRNAVAQLLAGNTHDPYVPFRAHFKEVCLTKDADPDVYLDDLQSIKQAIRKPSSVEAHVAFLDQLGAVHTLIEQFSRFIADGELDFGECVTLIPLLSKVEGRVQALKQSVMDRKNTLADMSNRDFARYANRRRG